MLVWMSIAAPACASPASPLRVGRTWEPHLWLNVVPVGPAARDGGYVVAFTLHEMREEGVRVFARRGPIRLPRGEWRAFLAEDLDIPPLERKLSKEMAVPGGDEPELPSIEHVRNGSLVAVRCSPGGDDRIRVQVRAFLVENGEITYRLVVDEMQDSNEWEAYSLAYHRDETK